MISSRATLVAMIAAALVVAPAFATRTHRSAATSHARSGQKLSSAHKASSTHKSSGRKASGRRVSSKMAPKSHKLHGQQAIDPQRVTQIQQALIREHYLGGDPTGQWDATTQAAMQKYQNDQGWQTRLMPDSRALKKLGLGPDYSGALNAKEATFAPPAAASTTPAGETAGFTAASGVN